MFQTIGAKKTKHCQTRPGKESKADHKEGREARRQRWGDGGWRDGGARAQEILKSP